MEPFRLTLAAGMAVGGLVYALLLRRREQHFSPYYFGEAIFGSALLVAAGHLTFCSFAPVHLVHFTDASGRPVEIKEWSAHLGEIHFIEIFVAGISSLAGGVINYSRAIQGGH